MARIIKREIVCSNSNSSETEANDSDHQHVSDRRTLRSRYLAVKTLIFDERDDISRTDSAKFNSIFNEVESLHQHVQKPREQIADAEALLDIANTLVTSVKATNGDGITVADFVNCLLGDFAKQSGLGGDSSNSQDGRTLIDWKKIGIEVSHVFRSSPGCRTMIGPMDTQLKQRRASVRRKRMRPAENVQPAEVDDTGTHTRTETDGNMSTMFDILRKHRRVKLEYLVLNRNSFAQTVENLFALSFLVKDGRAEIKMDEKGFHLVSPRNAPAARLVASKEVVYNHFVFRFDFKDWKLMTNYVEIGQEMMPNRGQVDVCSEAAVSITPIRKLSRNHGLVLREQSTVEDSPQSNDTEQTCATITMRK
ncbi:non-structural maintenance of chromosomes element 4 homolog A-like isoform X2 [Durio zibethinus]|uniref:Non-structural maintenance of chromosomes element 4 n=1 Tax=Durio zibethinus TaxID=66656 RepID=A0A6P6APQ2_DURZI|nr:non-structural maintenance of chromosomes element 4 homolog A-like isoform X2 [Durio zibethinus]